MGELYTDILVLAMCKLDNPLQWSNLRVFPQTRILRSDSPFGRDGCGFNHGKARAPLDNTAEVRHVPCGMMAIFSGVLA